MSLAGGRAPRKTAGNRLSGLLEAEEEDEFYQTTYGGFTEARAGPRQREGRKPRGVPQGEASDKGRGGEQARALAGDARPGGRVRGRRWRPGAGARPGRGWRSRPEAAGAGPEPTEHFSGCICHF